MRTHHLRTHLLGVRAIAAPSISYYLFLWPSIDQGCSCAAYDVLYYLGISVIAGCWDWLAGDEWGAGLGFVTATATSISRQGMWSVSAAEERLMGLLEVWWFSDQCGCRSDHCLTKNKQSGEGHFIALYHWYAGRILNQHGQYDIEINENKYLRILFCVCNRNCIHQSVSLFIHWFCYMLHTKTIKPM